MRYMVERDFVRVVGYIWQPGVGLCAYEYPLKDQDVENIGEFTRENVQRWLAGHAGDFQSVTDFCATLGDEEIEWQDQENGIVYDKCMR